jgi:hypothetical protein
MIGKLARALALGVALAAAIPAIPAMAQEPKVNSPPKRISGPDAAALREGALAVKVAGSCTVTFIVSEESKIKNQKIDCTIPEMVPYIEKAMLPVAYEAEIYKNTKVDSDPITQPFSWGASGGGGGAAPAAAVSNDKPPSIKTQLSAKAINRAITRVNKPGKCEVELTVGADGKPKDIKSTCDPDRYNVPITEAVKEMEFVPGTKNGVAADWPGYKLPPIGLTKPD